MSFKHKALSRKELLKIFAGIGTPDPPPIHNDPGTGADSPGNGNNGSHDPDICTKDYYTSCMSSPISDSDYCWKSALRACN